MQIKTIQSKMSPTLESLTDQSFFDIYAKLVELHETISIVQLDSQNFIIKSIGRKDFREIMLNKNLNDYLKEEAICELCTLYPENHDFENGDAGIASLLFNEILKISFLKKSQEEDRKNLMWYFRNEMAELHSQINCMIAETFPSLRYEEIENFDMTKTLKYLSRAEWILQNLRGFEMHRDPFTGEAWNTDDIIPENAPVKQHERIETPQTQIMKEQMPIVKEQEQSTFKSGESLEERIKRFKNGEIKQEQLSYEKLQRLQQQFPEIDWTAKPKDSDFKERISAVPVALRTAEELYHKE